MIFVIVLFLCMVCTTGAPVRGHIRTASAVLYEEDGLWGSIVFQQSSKSSPVLIKAIFKNVMSDNSSRVGYQIRSEPVHYDRYRREWLCSDYALKDVLSTSEKQIGDLVKEGRMDHITDHDFSQEVLDGEISLFEDSDRYIIGRSFVVRQGGSEDRFACSTILPVRRDDMFAGLVPCVKRSYEECLVGTEDPGLCVYRKCDGYERFWGEVDHSTTLCRVVEEVFPKVYGVGVSGKIGCRHGKHSLLVPVDPNVRN